MFSNAGIDEGGKVKESARPFIEEGKIVPCEFFWLVFIFVFFVEGWRGRCILVMGMGERGKKGKRGKGRENKIKN